MSLPAGVRRQLGVEKGGELLLRIENGEARLATVAETVRRVQASMRELTSGKAVSVDDFLAWKREQVALEEADVGRSGEGA